jgi:hypothetical protein
MNSPQNEHLRTFWACFPQAPNQPPVGNSPQTYLDELNEICGLSLSWPRQPPEDRLNRSQLRTLCRDRQVDVLVAYAAVMAWGGRNLYNYRLSLSNRSRRPLVGMLKGLRDSSQGRCEDFARAQKAATEIKGLGISFYTKLLFFLRKEPDAYILDQFTAKSARLLFDDCQVELNSSGFPDPKTTPEAYERFCDAAEALAASRIPPAAWTGEQVEQAMFDVRDGAWRKHLRSIYGKNGSRRTKQDKAPPPTTPRATVEAGTAALDGSDSLPARVARAHAVAYQNGEELPGSSPTPTEAPPIRVHCRLFDGVIWQYTFQKKSVHAQVFIPSRHIGRYNELRSHLGVSDHHFGDGIHGSGEKGGKTRSLRKTVDQGLDAHPGQWDTIAKEAVAAMSIMFQRLSENL